MIIGILMITILPKLVRTNDIPASRGERRLYWSDRRTRNHKTIWMTPMRGRLG